MNAILAKLVNPLRSKKMLAALATIITGYVAAAGFNVNEELVFTIVGAVVAVIVKMAEKAQPPAETEIRTHVMRSGPMDN